MTRPVWTWAGCPALLRAGSSISRLQRLTVVLALLCALWPAVASARSEGRPHVGRQAVLTSLHTDSHATRSRVAYLRLGSGEGTVHGSATVRRLQRGLRRSGYAPGPVDGRYGPLTAAAVQRFQANHGLSADGVVGPATHRALVAVPALALGAGESSEHGSPAVARLQRLLRHAGFTPGPVDGRFGPRTEHALTSFQRARHLRVDGVAGPMTGRALEVQQRIPVRHTTPRGGRHTGPARTAPVRHARQPVRSLEPRPAVLTPPATPNLPTTWILIALGALGITAVLGSYYQRPIATRVGRLTRAVSTMRTVRPVASALPEPAPVKFVLYDDNGGGYYWTIVAENGEVLARSGSFASYEEANDAAYAVHQGAAVASFENRSGGSSAVDLPAPRDAIHGPGRPEVRPGQPTQESPRSEARATPWPTLSRPWPSGVSSTPGGRRR